MSQKDGKTERPEDGKIKSSEAESSFKPPDFLTLLTFRLEISREDGKTKDRNEDNLMYWALDLYCKGYEFDCKLDGYGAMGDAKDQNFPRMDSSLEDHYFELAMDAYNKRNLGMAIIHFSTVIKINPKDPNAWYSRAIIKDELHSWKAARQDYDKAIELAPDFVDAIVNRAANKDEAGEYNEAIKDLVQ